MNVSKRWQKPEVNRREKRREKGQKQMQIENQKSQKKIKITITTDKNKNNKLSPLAYWGWFRKSHTKFRIRA